MPHNTKDNSASELFRTEIFCANSSHRALLSSFLHFRTRKSKQNSHHFCPQSTRFRDFDQRQQRSTRMLSSVCRSPCSCVCESVCLCVHARSEGLFSKNESFPPNFGEIRHANTQRETGGGKARLPTTSPAATAAGTEDTA